MAQRVGFGYDSHVFGADRPLILAGVTIEHRSGLKGHSDGDAICHAVTDALLGAAALGDIGRHFPDTDPRWKNADSMQMLRHVVGLVSDHGFRIGNVDSTVITETPRLAAQIDTMRKNLSGALDIPMDAVSIKAKTNEGMDAVGTGQGLVVHAIALLESA
jgi:2-C-methyl-D-erythritol 2,4-cyclodiphosphate synthase